MKKVILFAMTFCLGLTAHAENTDISELENVIYFDPVTVLSGTQHTLSVKMKNSVEAEGFGFDLYLPNGMTVAIDGDGFPEVALSLERTNEKKTNSFDAAFQPDGCLRVLAASTNGSAISGNDGEVCLITIIVAMDMSEGDYPVYLRNIAVSDTNAQSHRTDEVEMSISVEESDGRIGLYENSTEVPAFAQGVNVRVTRTLKANEWSTICLPFAMTEEQVITAFGNDVGLGDFQGYEHDADAGKITVLFNDVTAMEANHPYIIRVTQATTEFIVDGVDVAPSDNPRVSFATGKKKKDFVGTFVANFDFYEDAKNTPLFLSGNRFWYASEDTQKMKAFRAYFDFDDEEPGEGADTRVDFAFNDGEATGINVVQGTEADGTYYNLNGQAVKSPAKGLYIRQGKKVIMK